MNASKRGYLGTTVDGGIDDADRELLDPTIAEDFRLWIRVITIDGIKHTAPMLVLGTTLLAITGRGTDHEIFVEGSDVHIDHDDLVHLFGGEHFYTTPQVEGWVPSPDRVVNPRTLIFITQSHIAS